MAVPWPLRRGMPFRETSWQPWWIEPAALRFDTPPKLPPRVSDAMSEESIWANDVAAASNSTPRPEITAWAWRPTAFPKSPSTTVEVSSARAAALPSPKRRRSSRMISSKERSFRSNAMSAAAHSSSIASLRRPAWASTQANARRWSTKTLRRSFPSRDSASLRASSAAVECPINASASASRARHHDP